MRLDTTPATTSSIAGNNHTGELYKHTPKWLTTCSPLARRRSLVFVRLLARPLAQAPRRVRQRRRARWSRATETLACLAGADGCSDGRGYHRLGGEEEERGPPLEGRSWSATDRERASERACERRRSISWRLQASF